MKRPQSFSIATRDRSWDGWGPADTWLPNPDPILKAIGADISTYRDMRTDAHIGGCIRRRKAAVKGLEYVLEGTGRPKKAIEDILANIAGTPDPNEPGAQSGLTGIIAEALDGALYGYQPLEVTWAKVGALIVPSVVQAKPPEWFQFDNANQLRFRSKEGGANGELLPSKKFLLARQDASYANPYGQPDLALCYWPWQFRRAAKFWVQWLERYGGDFIIGKLPRSAPDSDYNSLSEQLAEMIQDSVAAIPDDGAVEVLASSSKAGSTDAHERFLMYWRGEISIALLGSNQGIETNSTNASATASLEVGKDIRDGDARMIESVVNQLIRWTCAINWPAATPPVWCLREQEEIDTDRPTRDKILVEAGARLTRAYWLKTYDLEEEDLAEDLPPVIPQAPGTQPQAQAQEAEEPETAEEPEDDEDPADMAEKAIRDGQDLIDAELERDARDRQQAAIERLVSPITTALADGLTPEEIMGKMDEWYGQLDDSLLQDLLTQGMAAADAIGRIEAQAA